MQLNGSNFTLLQLKLELQQIKIANGDCNNIQQVGHLSLQLFWKESEALLRCQKFISI